MQLGFSVAITRVIQFVTRGFANIGNAILGWFTPASGMTYNGAVMSVPADKTYLSVSSTPSIQPLLGDFSINGHFNITSPDNANFRTIISYRDAVTNKGIFFGLNTVRQIIFRFGDGATTVQSDGPAVLALGLHHYTVSITRGGNAVIYVDGAVYATVSVATVTGSINPTAPFVVGAREIASVYDYYMDGWNDSMSIWRRALALSEVTWLYNSGNGREYAEINGSVYDTKTTRVGAGLLNGDFQTLGGGGGDTFSLWSEGYTGTGSIVADTVAPYVGVRSCKYNFGAAGNAYVAFNMTFIPGFTVGKVYKITIVGKASQAIALNLSDGYNAVGVGSSYFSLDTTYKTYTSYISFGRYNVGRTTLYLLPASQPANGSINLGLVTIEEVPLTTFWGFKESSGKRYDSRYINHLTNVSQPIVSFNTYGQEQVVNPGFELVFSTGWGTGSPDGGSITRDSVIKHSGVYSCKLVQGNGQTRFEQDITVVAGETYNLSFWTYGDGTNDGGYSIYDVTNSATLRTASTGVTAAAWTLVSYQFTVPSSCTTIRITFRGKTTTGVITYFDDISLKRVTNGAVNNGGFEADTATPPGSWVRYGNHTASAVADGTAPHGTNVAVVTSTGVGGFGSGYFGVADVIDKNYKLPHTISFYAKSISGNTTLYFGIQTNGAGDATTSVTITTSWALYTINLTSLPNPTCSGLMAFYLGGTGVFRIDNVLLYCNDLPLVQGIASSVSAVTNDPIANWYDATANHKDLQSIAMASRPTLTLNAINGFQSPTFNGLTQHLKRSEDMIGVGDVTFYFVFKIPTYGGNGNGKIISNGVFSIFTSANNGGCLRLTSNNSTEAQSGAGSVLTNVVYLGVLTRTSAGVTNFRINGSASGTANQSSGTPAAGTSTYIGNNSALDRGFNGYLPEIVDVQPGIDSLSQIQGRELILRSKYNIW